ncbi:DNA helicase RecQ [Gemmiger formicilis]|uniref:DNA helicase RecQ n=1 Tax=Gemmiger formicilis TaxID=745368 RepID=UPI0019564488|nr:DNA helicase RecQ [Gemmiger formicilis]MBM6716675.1 DNA helicase RecQ [Gemmiger formicilis]
MNQYDVLQKYFGHDSFRPGQETLVNAILTGHDVLGVMPTGAGKSVCYQVPAMLLPGLTLVISPLISLMQDQVAALRQSGIEAACIHSGMEEQEYWNIVQGARLGQYKLLYVAPERLETDGFLSLVSGIRVSLVAVDEAHCVSQWGQDFRPSYLRIASFLEKLSPRPPVGAFTATATGQVKQDIARLLELRDPVSITTGFDRPNLYFAVERPRDKDRFVEDYILDHPDKSGIVYCATRKTVELVCNQLRRAKIAATRYHAGLEAEERRKNQEDFVYDRRRVMVATNAFGMGIDKSNVGFVIHYNMPKNIENYYQEAGRAGRDGSSAECILLYSLGDVQTARFLIQNSHDNEELSEEQAVQIQRLDLQRLDRMVAYCKTTRCLRGFLLEYFGQRQTGNCGNCSNCRGDFVQTDITTEAQKILSGVARIEKRWPGGLGVVALVQMLRGSKDKNTLKRGLDTLPTYGIMQHTSPARMRLYLDALEEQGYIINTQGEYPVVRLAADAKEVLFNGKTVTMTERKAAEKSNKTSKTKEVGVQADLPQDLYERLRAVRSELAQKQHVPAYIILSNASLAEMASKRPRTTGDLMRISGVGEARAHRYGQKFLQAIAEYMAQHPQG